MSVWLLSGAVRKHGTLGKEATMSRPGINPVWGPTMRSALRKLDLFEDRRRMKQFIRESAVLSVWVDAMPWDEDNDPRTNVDRLIEFFLEKKHSTFGWVFPLFIEALISKYADSIVMDHMDAVRDLREILPRLQADAATWSW